MTDSTYVDGFVCAVNNQNKQAYIEYAKKFGTIFREYGALEVVDCWGDDVPEGKLTSFTMAVSANPTNPSLMAGSPGRRAPCATKRGARCRRMPAFSRSSTRCPLMASA